VKAGRGFTAHASTTGGDEANAYTSIHTYMHTYVRMRISFGCPAVQPQEAKKRNDLQSAVPLLLKANDLFRRADTVDVPDDAAEPDAA
jgi:hypothetical protein